MIASRSYFSGATPLLRSLLQASLIGAALLGLQGCAELVEQHNEPAYALHPLNESPLAVAARQAVGDGGQSVFRPIPFSDYSMDARLTLVRNAKASIDVQFYLVAADSTGCTLLAALRDAAERGVRIRFLVDDLYTAQSERLLKDFAVYPNVEVRLFNPFPVARTSDLGRWLFALSDIARLNHRMHNKLMVVDGAFAVAGGRNMADEYFFRSKEGNFIDFDLLVAGDVVSDLEASFDKYWNSRRVYALRHLDEENRSDGERKADFDRIVAAEGSPYPALKESDRDMLNYAPLSTELGVKPLKLLRGRIRVVSDDPEKVSGKAESGKDSTTVTSAVIVAIDQAHESVLLASPYFVPGAASMKRLANARARGVTVTSITNSMASNDEPLVSAAYSRYRLEMLKMGMQLYEVSPRILQRNGLEEGLGSSTGRLHAKAIVIDGQTTFVGSMNLDFRSSRENTELGLFIDSPDLASTVTELFDTVRNVGTYRLRLTQDGDVQWVDSNAGQETIYDSEPEVGWPTRLKLLLLSPIVSEDLL